MQEIRRSLLLLILNFPLHDYWVYLRDRNPFLMHTAIEVEIELPLFLIHNCNRNWKEIMCILLLKLRLNCHFFSPNCNRNWKAIVYRIATVTEIEDNNFHYHDCHRYWKLDWAFAETDMRLKFSAKLLSLLLLLHLIFSPIVTDVDIEQNIFVTVFLLNLIFTFGRFQVSLQSTQDAKATWRTFSCAMCGKLFM